MMRYLTFRIMKFTAVVKAFALLEATAGAAEGGLSLGELADSVGVNKTTAHRLLKTLILLGYVENRSYGHYRQTAQVRRLLGGIEDQRLLDVATPLLGRLHQQLNETVNLGILRAGQVVYLQVLESTQPLRRVATLQAVDPFYCTALGRVVVAFLPEPQLEMLLDSGPFQARTAHTVTDPQALRAELAMAFKRGYAIEKDQTDLGVTCIGAPILKDAKPVAAVSVSIPTVRSSSSSEATLISAICKTAEDISQALL